MTAKIEITKLPKMYLAYVPGIGMQEIGKAYGKLIQWASPKGLMDEETKLVTIYHDSYKERDADKVKMSAAILLKKPTETDEEVGLTSIEAGKFIVGRYEIELNEFEKSWTGLFLWMNENGYKKAARAPFEIYHNNFNDHPERKAIVDLHIPIEEKAEK